MKKILPLAVASALAGVNAAQAVVVNPDGLGQALVYPFYTTESGQSTLINVVNTTGGFKAVKVRVLESMNSVEVLDFNLYLSPYDHWSAVIKSDESGSGAVIQSNDLTCTVPTAISEGSEAIFRDFEFSSDSVNGPERTREGYVEILEMATLDESDPGMASILSAIEHVNGIPGGEAGSCDTVQAQWVSGGYFTVPNRGALAPTGGLYGYGVIIDVEEGTDATYDALALDSWRIEPNHTNPGEIVPSLNSAEPPVAYAFYNDPVAGGVALDLSPLSGRGDDAVSAVLMHQAILNDYVLEESINAGTDWAITFPTKRDYVNGFTVARTPFTEVWNPETSKACEEIAITYYDREETPENPEDVDFSPRPEGLAFALCAEANVLTFNSSDVLEASTRTGVDLNVIHESGWMEIDFSDAASGRTIDTVDGTLSGLPVVGFAVQKYVNGALNGVLSNYAGAITHKGVRSISD